MSPEEADAVRARIRKLQNIGKKLLQKSREKSDKESPPDENQYRLKVWLGEVSSLIKTAFKDNPALTDRSDKIFGSDLSRQWMFT